MTEGAPTPSQTAGPYLALGLLGDEGATRLVEPDDPRAVRIYGRLTDGAGKGMPDGVVEFWQANAAGRYRHPADGRQKPAVEEGFDGFGRSGTADDGRFEFLTVKPGAVPWPTGGVQAPHIAVTVFARGLLKAAVTRLYFPDEAKANAADPILSRLTRARRETLVAVPEDGGMRFDIRLQGPRQTTFFAL